MELDALVPVGSVERTDRAADERARGSQTQNPAQVLAHLMDFPGSIALAELLQEPVPEGDAHPQAARLARKLKDKVDAYFENALPQVLRPLTGRRAPSAPGTAALLDLIRSACGDKPVRPDEKAVQRLARELGAPFRAAFRESLGKAQVQLNTLRAKVAMDVRELGPRAARLEQIDAVLQRSIETKFNELLERFELAAELTFERACQHACAELPDNFGEHELAAWIAGDGWIELYRERCVRMTQALFGHLRRSLEGLLFAAAAAEVS